MTPGIEIILANRQATRVGELPQRYVHARSNPLLNRREWGLIARGPFHQRVGVVCSLWNTSNRG